MNTVMKQLFETGIIPVVVIEDAQNAQPLANALYLGGLRCAEITFRTEAAAHALKIMNENYPKMLLGAGTILTIEQVDRAVEAGAKFIVSPGLNPKIVDYCQSIHVPIIPGVTSPSEIESALELGLDVVKFFPAEPAGGIKMIKALSAPYSGVRFMPTGGINTANITAYLKEPKVIACGGSWMVSKHLIEQKDFDTIEKLTREAVSLLHGFSLKHIGFTVEMQTKAHALADQFSHLLDLKVNANMDSLIVGKHFEIVTHQNTENEKGFIVIGCHNIQRVIPYLRQKGFTIDETALGPKASNKCIMLNERMGGYRMVFELNE